MKQSNADASLETLQDIKNIMERSARFLSLSGLSGVWAGIIGLAGALIANSWLNTIPADISGDEYDNAVYRFILLAVAVLAVAIAGGYYFTLRKSKKQGVKLWNNASRKMLMNIAIPMTMGGLFALHFMYNHHINYIAPICLSFYGLALINGGKYTHSDIHYLGLSELALACISLFVPGYGLLLWSIGFGALHILYGIIVWNKYDKQTRAI